MAKFHTLKATLDTVKWGYFDNTLKPALTVQPGDVVELLYTCDLGRDVGEQWLGRGQIDE